VVQKWWSSPRDRISGIESAEEAREEGESGGGRVQGGGRGSGREGESEWKR